MEMMQKLQQLCRDQKRHTDDVLRFAKSKFGARPLCHFFMREAMTEWI